MQPHRAKGGGIQTGHTPGVGGPHDSLATIIHPQRESNRPCCQQKPDRHNQSRDETPPAAPIITLPRWTLLRRERQRTSSQRPHPERFQRDQQIVATNSACELVSYANE